MPKTSCSPIHRRGCAKSAGFTVVEMVVACGVISIFVIGSMLALTQVNRFATASRLRTIALALAEERIDEILTTPWLASGPPPAVLAVGTRSESALPLGHDALNNQSTLSSDATAFGMTVNATRTTQITDVAARRVRAVVSVNYTYRDRAYQVALTTLRTTDSF